MTTAPEVLESSHRGAVGSPSQYFEDREGDDVGNLFSERPRQEFPNDVLFDIGILPVVEMTTSGTITPPLCDDLEDSSTYVNLILCTNSNTLSTAVQFS